MASRPKVVLFLLIFTLTTIVRVHSNVQNLNDICESEKSGDYDISIGATPTEFTLSLPAKKRFKCHLEVDTEDGMGLHVFIKEMDLDCSKQDLIGFGRAKIWQVKTRSDYDCASPTTRFYTESYHKDVDAWIDLKNSSRKRRISIVFTPLKKQCSKNDLSYLEIPGTGNCILRDALCDPDNGWPNGEQIRKQAGCEEIAPKTFPVVLVSSGVLVFVLLIAGGLLAWCLCHKYRRGGRGAANGPGNTGANAVSFNASREQGLNLLPTEQPSGQPPEDAQRPKFDTLPSYEEATGSLSLSTANAFLV